MFALKYEHISAVEGAPKGSFEGKPTPTFEVVIKGALDVTIESHLKMHVVVHFLAQKSAQNDSIKGKLVEIIYVALAGSPKISL